MSTYNYLGLVNDVNRRLNEVELKQATFDGAIGYYASVKDAVNSSIRHINQSQFEWPFNHAEAEDVLTEGQVRYAFPSDMKTADMDSFRIKRSEEFNNETRKLKILSYEEYLEKYVDDEYNEDNESIRTLPQFVFRSPDLSFGVVPPPDEPYELVYEYYRLPVDLQKAEDVPTIPEQFRHVIVEGAMYYTYQFRGDLETASLSLQKFNQGIEDMRTIYINRYDYVRSSMITRKRTSLKVR